LRCPACTSENTQRLEVAFDGGTQDIESKSRSIGLASVGGNLGIGGATTKTKGRSQSVLAQKAAPPAKKSIKWAVLLAFFGLMFTGQPGGVSVIGYLMLAGGVYLGYTVRSFNR
jgi:hypothetical protein